MRRTLILLAVLLLPSVAWAQITAGSPATTASDTDDASVATGQTTSVNIGLTHVYDGSVWRRLTFGTAGTASAQVITVQGIASMTPLLATVTATNLDVQIGGSDTVTVTATNLDVQSGGADVLSTTAHDAAFGTAGTADAQVRTVQGVALMTPLLVDGSATTQPVSGTVTATATNLDVQIGGSDTVTVTDGAGAMNVIIDSGTTAVTATNLDVQIGGSDTVTVTDGAGAMNTIIDSGTVTTVSTVTTLSQFGGNAIDLGSGTIGTGTLRVNLATDDPVNDAAVETSAAIGATAAAVPTSATQIGGTDGTNLVVPYVDPCQREARTQFVVDIVTATTTEIDNQVASEFFYLCSVSLFSAGTNNVAIVEDDTDACTSPTAGLSGGVTAAEGYNFVAQTGIATGTGGNWVMKTTTANRYLCIITSAAVQLSGAITYVSSP